MLTTVLAAFAGLTVAVVGYAIVWKLMRREQRRQIESMGAAYERIQAEVMEQHARVKAELETARRTAHRATCGETLLPGVYCARPLGHGGAHDAGVRREGMA